MGEKVRGSLSVNVSEISFDEVHQLFSKDVEIGPGGHWRPKDCKPRWKVAVLIPFRNRHEHLPIFFLHLIPMLQKQRLEFAFYVIEQVRTVFRMPLNILELQFVMEFD
ncbi:hypothetical protein U0070_004708 [Myodes glareolus]|uniref:Galactosyltransferase N-terminal domain-containing protein n=1 Tax=Myodes glareolus TaxID=447135 RepID=A0AAW0IAD4_MYOGA